MVQMHWSGVWLVVQTINRLCLLNITSTYSCVYTPMYYLDIYVSNVIKYFLLHYPCSDLMQTIHTYRFNRICRFSTLSVFRAMRHLNRERSSSCIPQRTREIGLCDEAPKQRIDKIFIFHTSSHIQNTMLLYVESIFTLRNYKRPKIQNE